jgi:hypothetical protein
MVEEKDEELEAIKALLEVLTPLKPDSRANVIDFVFRRLGITGSVAVIPGAHPTFVPNITHTSGPTTPLALAAGTMDLRSLTLQKKPKTANQMVAIVAYYLAHFAPDNERRDYMVADDIKKYFVQANYALPTGPPGMTLVNAKNAGYLDAIMDGKYRLNPVGHNLVTHKLPRDSERGAVKKLAKPSKKKKARK